jgi:hypothetical protein
VKPQTQYANAAVSPRAADTATRAQGSRRRLPGRARRRGAARAMSRQGRSAARHAQSTRSPRGQRPHSRFAWYLGLTLMATFEVIEWPLAIVVSVGHEVLHRTHSRALQEILRGMAAGR